MPENFVVELTPLNTRGKLDYGMNVLVDIAAESEIDAIMHAFWTRNIPTNWIVTCVISDETETQHNLSYHGAMRISQRV